jgi:hypothetical protein
MGHHPSDTVIPTIGNASKTSILFLSHSHPSQLEDSGLSPEMSPTSPTSGGTHDVFSATQDVTSGDTHVDVTTTHGEAEARVCTRKSSGRRSAPLPGSHSNSPRRSHKHPLQHSGGYQSVASSAGTSRSSRSVFSGFSKLASPWQPPSIDAAVPGDVTQWVPELRERIDSQMAIDTSGEFHDQGDAKWVVILGQLRGHNDTPFGRPTVYRPLWGWPPFGRIWWFRLLLISSILFQHCPPHHGIHLQATWWIPRTSRRSRPS